MDIEIYYVNEQKMPRSDCMDGHSHDSSFKFAYEVFQNTLDAYVLHYYEKYNY